LGERGTGNGIETTEKRTDTVIIDFETTTDFERIITDLTIGEETEIGINGNRGT
jgi:hypothetical protein